MVLAVDIGNTNVVIGVFRGGELLASWRLAAARDRTPDEWWVLLGGVAGADRVDLGEIDGAILASVVPRLTRSIADMVRRRLGLEPFIVDPGTDLSVAIRVENPAEVGADRLVNVVAARTRFSRPCVVVDFGTATTFDVISAAGDYLGGAIAPGFTGALDALTSQAARLTAVDLEVPAQAIGRNTTQSIQSGALLGYVGLIEGMVKRISGELGAVPTVVATGGLGALFVDQTTVIHVYEPDLTLIGLNLVYERLWRS
jgi:type III pantothenate kinase